MTDTIIVELTPQEAGVLRVVLERIGGHPETTARGWSDSANQKIREAMQKAGYTHHELWSGWDFAAQDACFVLNRNAIYFTEQSHSVPYFVKEQV